MRVLLVTSDAYGCNGGIAQYNRDLVEAIAAMPGTEQVTVLARNRQFEVPPLAPGIVLEARATEGTVGFLGAAAGLARQSRDLIVCGHINLLPVAALLAWRSRCPLVLMAYGIDVWEPPSSRLVRWLAQRVDAVWSISDFTRRRASRWLDIRSTTYRLLPNAVHLDRYGVAAAPADMRARYRGQASHVILTLGRLASSERYKGIDEMLEVLPTVLPSHPGLKYLIAGDGDDRPRLERRVAELGLGGHVDFVGYVREEEKADLYRLADVFAMPGRGEGFGFVFLEAMACGTPVLASTVDGSFEAVRHGEIGRAVDPGDSVALREALLAVLAQAHAVPPGLRYFSFDEFGKRLGEAISVLPRRARHIQEKP